MSILITIAVIVAFFACGVVLASTLQRRWRNRPGFYTLEPPEQGEHASGRGKTFKLNLRPELEPEPEGTPVSETEDGKRWASIAASTCPHCKSYPARFSAGPSGGMSTNIECEHCGWWFNVTPVIGIAQDIGFRDREVH